MAGEIVLGYDGEPGSRAALQTAVAIAPKPNHSANVSGSGIGLIVTLKLPALS